MQTAVYVCAMIYVVLYNSESNCPEAPDKKAIDGDENQFQTILTGG